MTGADTAIPTGAPDRSERRWSATRRAADLTWVLALLVAIPLSPVARWYLLTWPGVVEWCLVVLIAAGVLVHSIAERRQRAIPGPVAAVTRSADRPDEETAPATSRLSEVVGWTVVALLLPVTWVCLVEPLLAATSFDWGPTRSGGVVQPVVIATFLLCPYLVGLLVLWLVRGVRSAPQRVIAATVVACATGLLVYGSLGHVPPLLGGLL